MGYMRQPPIPDLEPDKQEILASLREGKAVPGCALKVTNNIQIK
jgi:hypothetical protein